jgi:hypothetical protein
LGLSAAVFASDSRLDATPIGRLRISENFSNRRSHFADKVTSPNSDNYLRDERQNYRNPVTYIQGSKGSDSSNPPETGPDCNRGLSIAATNTQHSNRRPNHNNRREQLAKNRNESVEGGRALANECQCTANHLKQAGGNCR